MSMHGHAFDNVRTEMMEWQQVCVGTTKNERNN